MKDLFGKDIVKNSVRRGRRIGFDLDGSLNCFTIEEYNKCETEEDRVSYLTYLPTRENPFNYLDKEDKGYIITARAKKYMKITIDWLAKNRILFPIHFASHNESWETDEQFHEEVPVLKAKKINDLKLHKYYDDDEKIVLQLRRLCPSTEIVLWK